MTEETKESDYLHWKACLVCRLAMMEHVRKVCNLWFLMDESCNCNLATNVCDFCAYKPASVPARGCQWKQGSGTLVLQPWSISDLLLWWFIKIFGIHFSFLVVYNRWGVTMQVSQWSTEKLVCLFVFQDSVSLWSLGQPGTHSIDQAGLKFKEIHLPLPSECWD